MASGAEANSAADGVDTAVGEATETARTGSSTKTQNKSQDPKVQVIFIYCCTFIACKQLCMHDFWSGAVCMTYCCWHAQGFNISATLQVPDAPPSKDNKDNGAGKDKKNH